MYIWKKQTRAALYPNKIIMKKNKIKFIMMAFVFLFSILFLSNDYVQAAIHTIPDSNLSAVLNAKKMRMTKDNVSYKWNTTGGKVFHDDAGYEFAFFEHRHNRIQETEQPYIKLYKRHDSKWKAD